MKTKPISQREALALKKRLKAREDTFSERLDAAVEERFPSVRCETTFNIFAMRMVSEWWRRGDDDKRRRLAPGLGRQVSFFVEGFAAAEESAP